MTPMRNPTHDQTRRAPGRKQTHDDTRNSAAKRGYDRKWQRMRAWHLARNPLCDLCAEQGRTTAATDVHHIVPISQNGERLNQTNLQSLCHACHSKLTAKRDEKHG